MITPPKRRITRTNWLAIAELLFAHPHDMEFRCVACGHHQSIRSAAKAGVDVSEADAWIFFACEGRVRPGVGCDWSLGGLFRIHNLEVIDDRPGEAAEAVPCFDFSVASVLGERV